MIDFYKSIEKIYKSSSPGSFNGFITGDGKIPCPILFIGEAPGKNEVLEGKPFVGVAGKNFEKYLNLIGLTRDHIRITNTCYGRPIKEKILKNGKISISNRTPKISEINMFYEILDLEINACSPKIIITLGNTPLKRILGQGTIGDYHGKCIKSEKYNCLVYPMYHPSALTYNRNDKFEKMYKDDWLKLKMLQIF